MTVGVGSLLYLERGTEGPTRSGAKHRQFSPKTKEP